jgi:hypothetical protein
MKREKGIHDDITRGAYELYEKRGMAHGHDIYFVQQDISQKR